MDERRVQQLALDVVADVDLPFAIITVVPAPEGWCVIAKDDAGQVRRFPVRPGAPSAVRAAIKCALEGELS